jgi:uncharacterized protein YaeQ
MTMHDERREYRLTFTNVDRGVSDERPLVLSRHPSESAEHLTLRVLAWVLLWQDGLEFGPGVCVGDAPDLVAHDLTGQVQSWIACGDVSLRLARRILQHNRYAAVHVVFGGRARRDAFVAEVEGTRGERPRGWDRLSLWTLDQALVEGLAAEEKLRQRWSVTVVGDHMYVERDGRVFEGAVLRG